MQAQLRRYLIQPGLAAQFAAEWQEAVAPLRRAFGFDVHGWLVADSDEFVWVIAHSSRESFEAADAAYYDSPERRAVQPDPARLIVDAQKDWVTTVA